MSFLNKDVIVSCFKDLIDDKKMVKSFEESNDYNDLFSIVNVSNVADELNLDRLKRAVKFAEENEMPIERSFVFAALLPYGETDENTLLAGRKVSEICPEFKENCKKTFFIAEQLDINNNYGVVTNYGFGAQDRVDGVLLSKQFEQNIEMFAKQAKKLVKDFGLNERPLQSVSPN